MYMTTIYINRNREDIKLDSIKVWPENVYINTIREDIKLDSIKVWSVNVYIKEIGKT